LLIAAGIAVLGGGGLLIFSVLRRRAALRDADAPSGDVE